MAEYVTMKHKSIVLSDDKFTVYNSTDLNDLDHVAISVYFRYFSSGGISGKLAINKYRMPNLTGGKFRCSWEGGGCFLPRINT